MARNFENFIEAFMEYSSFTQSPEKFLRWSAYSVVAGALERKVWLSNGGTTFYPNLYVCLVGDAGTRKSSSANLAVDLLRQVPGIHFMANRINEASFHESLLMAGLSKKFEHADRRFPHSASYLFASEAATSFAEMYAGGGIVIALTDVFNCEPLGWNDKVGWSRGTKSEGTKTVLNPCLNLLACSTPAWFTEKVMSRMDAEAGFGSRMLVVMQKERFARAFGWNEINASESGIKIKLVQDLQAINQLSGPFSVDNSFRKTYAALDEKLHTYITSQPISPLMAGYYERKLAPHSVKLAMVQAVCERSDLRLTGADLLKAWTLVESLEANMIQAHANANGEKSVSDEIASYLINNKISQITKTKLITTFGVRYQLKDVTKGIDLLVKTGRLKFDLSTAQSLREITFKFSNEPTQDHLPM